MPEIPFQGMLESIAKRLAAPRATVTAVFFKACAPAIAHLQASMSPLPCPAISDDKLERKPPSHGKQHIRVQQPAGLGETQAGEVGLATGDYDVLCCAQVAGEVIGAVGSDSVQWLDDGTEHPHRIALSVQSSRVPDVCHRLTQGTLNRGVKVSLNPDMSASTLTCSRRPADTCIAASQTKNQMWRIVKASAADCLFSRWRDIWHMTAEDLLVEISLMTWPRCLSRSMMPLHRERRCAS